MQPTNFSQELAVMSARNMTRGNLVSSKKNLDVQKGCIAAAKHNVVSKIRLTSTSLAAKDSIKEHWTTVAMVDHCQSIAKC